MPPRPGRYRRPFRVPQCVALAVIVVALSALHGGCRRSASTAVDADVAVQFEPEKPVVGTAQVTIKLTDQAGQPLSAEVLEVEGNMNHAGMKPVFSTFRQTRPGEYQGSLEFTMAGDWFLLLTGQLDDGRLIHEKVDVAGVERR